MTFTAQLAESEPVPWAPSGSRSLLGVSFLSTCKAPKHCCDYMAVPLGPIASPLLWERLDSYMQPWWQFCAWSTLALLHVKLVQQCDLYQEGTGNFSWLLCVALLTTLNRRLGALLNTIKWPFNPIPMNVYWVNFSAGSPWLWMSTLHLQQCFEGSSFLPFIPLLWGG